jgi:hypothetical protein
MSGGEAATGVTLSQVAGIARTTQWSGVVRGGVRQVGCKEHGAPTAALGFLELSLRLSLRAPSKNQDAACGRGTMLLHSVRPHPPVRPACPAFFVWREERLRSRASSASQARVSPDCSTALAASRVARPSYDYGRVGGARCPSERFAPLARTAPGDSWQPTQQAGERGGVPCPSSLCQSLSSQPGDERRNRRCRAVRCASAGRFRHFHPPKYRAAPRRSPRKRGRHWRRP